MSLPPGPEPGQSLEDWVRESLLGPLPGEVTDDTTGPAAPDGPDAPETVVPAQRSAPPPVLSPTVPVPAQRSAPPAISAATDRGPAGTIAHTPPRVLDPLPAAMPPDGLGVGAPARRRAVLGAATGVAAVLGLAMVAFGPAESARVPEQSAVVLDATQAPTPALTSVSSTPAPALPAAVAVPFAGGRVDVGGGWRIGVTRPYLCPVLMTIPSLASGDSRMVRMTVTIVNDTGAAQPARAWTLQATAGGSPVEMILWPSAGFRGVPDRVLAPGERVRFLVAVRLPAQKVAVEVAATHPSGVRAALTGRV